ncbi:MAG: RIP metalloprotease RseP [Candidatus Komeilibacteria bacterium]|nr:RIP metalloprotease RseP [Candidatus Komeilibacteria bacterium]
MFLTIVIFILILSVLVFVHELGHFLVARKNGVRVEEFGLGFPPRLWGVKKGDTLYSLNLIPLGGFVRLKGEDGSLRDEGDSFASKPFYAKGLILAAGVLMNIVLAFFIFSAGYMIGLPTALSDEELNQPQVSQVKIRVVGVAQNSPAAAAGLVGGDLLLEVNGQPAVSHAQVTDYVKQNQDQPIQLKVQKADGEVKDYSIIPANIAEAGPDKVLGVNILQTGLVRYGFFASFYQGLLTTVGLLWRIITAFYGLIAGLITGQGLAVELSGPIGVAVLTGQALEMGFSYLLQFAGLLSLNLAVINFFPFPALDGGRFVFAVIEKIRRRPNNQQVENVIHNLGFGLLLLLIAVITYRDIAQSTGFIDRIKSIF